MVTVLIPAYNEAERIEATVAAARSLVGIDEIIVIDDGSKDETAAKAQAAGARVVIHRSRTGKGGALQTGFSISQGDILLLLDADLGETAREAQCLLDPLTADETDMTIATFPVLKRKGGGVGLVVRLARWGIQRLTDRLMAAPLSGQRAVRRQIVSDCGGFAAGWGTEVALTVQALRAGYRVQEIPTTMNHRVTGRSLKAIFHRGSQFIGVLRVLLRLYSEVPAIKSI